MNLLAVASRRADGGRRRSLGRTFSTTPCPAIPFTKCERKLRKLRLAARALAYNGFPQRGRGGVARVVHVGVIRQPVETQARASAACERPRVAADHLTAEGAAAHDRARRRGARGRHRRNRRTRRRQATRHQRQRSQVEEERRAADQGRSRGEGCSRNPCAQDGAANVLLVPPPARQYESNAHPKQQYVESAFAPFHATLLILFCLGRIRRRDDGPPRRPPSVPTADP